ncbi:MAG: dihydroxyacetone kinase family protein [Oscillospiraceae bacterium]|nr:dihydroxyacetone kinase family protein [Oscillospiraceae bacterium]
MAKLTEGQGETVRAMCRGFVLAHPGLRLDAGSMVVHKARPDPGKVALICGGGSGHEPAHAGYIGRGMLDAAVCGDVFASPAQSQVLRAIRIVGGPMGVLLIIKNYSGDVMNFLGAARAAEEEGIKVDWVIVDDDVAVNDSLYTVGRRGVAGTVFVHKVAGAAAERGMGLGEVKAAAARAIKAVRSIGVALRPCTPLSKGGQTLSIGPGEMEYGVGIHGEPGIRRAAFTGVSDLAAEMVGSLASDMGVGKVGSGEGGTGAGAGLGRVALMVNGFGATSLMELHTLYAHVRRELGAYGADVARSYVGNYMTSLDMEGASVTLMGLDGGLEGYLDDRSDAPAFPVPGEAAGCGAGSGRVGAGGAVGASGPGWTDLERTIHRNMDPYVPQEGADDPEPEGAGPDGGADAASDAAAEAGRERAVRGGSLSLGNVRHIIGIMAESAIRNEALFCEKDSHAGDGDFGTSIAKGFRAVRKAWVRLVDGCPDISSFLAECSVLLADSCGGASGPIWGSAFRAAGKAAEGKETLSPPEFAALLTAAVAGVREMGERSFGRGAAVGDKTLIDALAPCEESWVRCGAEGKGFAEAFALGARAAREGAERTKDMVARMGRAGNVGERSLGYHDAGAYALAVMFGDVASGVEA